MLAFRLNWKIALFTFTLLPLLLVLGFWQLDREAEKIALQAVFDDRLQQEPIAFAELPAGSGVGSEQALAYRRVTLDGSFDEQHYFLLDNRIHDGMVGYEVIMPFRTNDKTVLVNRGWVRAGQTREELPVLESVAKIAQITASIYVPTAEPFMLGSEIDTAGDDWPQRVQTADTQWMAQRLGETVFPYTVRLESGSPGVLQPNWPLLNMMPEKHRGYAVQWFSMAAVLLLLFIYSCFGTRRKTRDES